MDTFLSTKMKSFPIMLIGLRFPKTLLEILLVKPRGETMRGRSCLWLVRGRSCLWLVLDRVECLLM